MRVVATKDGHDGLTVRVLNEEFDMPDGSKGSWFKPVEVEPAVVDDEPADEVATQEVAPRRGRPPKAK